MSRPIDSENLYKFLTDQRVKERGAYSKGVNIGLDIARSALRNEQIAPTLTPQNEWVEALEAINNAAVAYIEGGPYENDLPGMELAVEIDRLSRDFVRPPNEPLTLERLREMDGEPVWVDDKKTWALLQVWDDDNIDAVFPMPRGCFHAESVVGKKIYRRQPEGEA